MITMNVFESASIGDLKAMLDDKMKLGGIGF